MGKRRRRGGTREEPHLLDIHSSRRTLTVIVIVLCALVCTYSPSALPRFNQSSHLPFSITKLLSRKCRNPLLQHIANDASQVICATFFRSSPAGLTSSRHGGRPSSQRNAAASGQRGVRSTTSGQPDLYGYRVVREFPHQPDAFTQGLEFERRCEQTSADGKAGQCRDVLWESTGDDPPLGVADRS